MPRNADDPTPQHPARTNPGKPTSPGAALRDAYLRSRKHYGHLGWWPGETPFEVCVGAILTQNTSWRNVEQAIRQLKATQCLTAEAMFALPVGDLEQLIRPSGYFRVKARRLRAFLEVLVERFEGRVDRLLAGPTDVVRDRVLAIPGVGPETADCMLLYAGGHPVFVIDAYARRILTRHDWCAANPPYEILQQLCAAAFREGDPKRELDRFQDSHAQFVMIGKDFCRPRKPLCEGCPLRELLPEASSSDRQATIA